MSGTSKHAVAWFAALLIGCAGGSEAQEMTLEVAPTTVECQGEAVQRCLLVREASDEEWRSFYDRIEGFTHEEGYRYRIRVLRERIVHPLADASGFTWRLLEVLSKEFVGEGEGSGSR